MYFWIVNCSLAFLLCVLCAGIVIPQILLIAFRKQLFDLPDERKIHHCAVPRLGGIAFKPVVFFTIALLLGINMALGIRKCCLKSETMYGLWLLLSAPSWYCIWSAWPMT